MGGGPWLEMFSLLAQMFAPPHAGMETGRSTGRLGGSSEVPLGTVHMGLCQLPLLWGSGDTPAHSTCVSAFSLWPGGQTCPYF